MIGLRTNQKYLRLSKSEIWWSGRKDATILFHGQESTSKGTTKINLVLHVVFTQFHNKLILALYHWFTTLPSTLERRFLCIYRSGTPKQPIFWITPPFASFYHSSAKISVVAGEPIFWQKRVRGVRGKGVLVQNINCFGVPLWYPYIFFNDSWALVHNRAPSNPALAISVAWSSVMLTTLLRSSLTAPNQPGL